MKSEYPYTYARVSAMKSKLLKRGDYDKLQKLSVGEIIKYLSENEYKKEIDKYAVTKNGVDLIEFALIENTSNTYLKLKRISESKISTLIDTYLIRNDIHNIKTIIRGIMLGKPADDIRELLISATKNQELFFENLLKSDSVEKVIDKLGFLDKVKANKALADYKDSKCLVHIENLLDQYMYFEMQKSAEEINHRRIEGFLRAEIKNANLKTILKFKKAGKDNQEILSLLIKPKRKTLSLVEKSYDDIIKSLQKKNKEITEDLLVTEAQVDKESLVKIGKLLHQKPLSADIILGYLLAKEIEMRNLRLIIKAKEFNLDDEFVENQLVVV